MSSKHLTTLAVAAMLGTIIWATSAGAMTLPSVFANACDETCVAEGGFNASSINSYATSTTIPDRLVTQSDAVSEATASANYNRLTASVSAAPNAYAAAIGAWQDEITISGGMGSAGTNGVAYLQGVINATLAVGSDQPELGFGVADFPSLSDFLSGYGENTIAQSGIPGGPVWQTPTSGKTTVQGSFSFVYGQPFVLTASIGTFLPPPFGVTYSGTGTSTFTVNDFSITNISLPGGATLTSLSGATYPVSTVPLPGGAWLFLSGLAGLVAIGRRRRKDVV